MCCLRRSFSLLPSCLSLSCFCIVASSKPGRESDQTTTPATVIGRKEEEDGDDDADDDDDEEDQPVTVGSGTGRQDSEGTAMMTGQTPTSTKPETMTDSEQGSSSVKESKCKEINVTLDPSIECTESRQQQQEKEAAADKGAKESDEEEDSEETAGAAGKAAAGGAAASAGIVVRDGKGRERESTAVAADARPVADADSNEDEDGEDRSSRSAKTTTPVAGSTSLLLSILVLVMAGVLLVICFLLRKRGSCCESAAGNESKVISLQPSQHDCSIYFDKSPVTATAATNAGHQQHLDDDDEEAEQEHDLSIGERTAFTSGTSGGGGGKAR